MRHYYFTLSIYFLVYLTFLSYINCQQQTYSVRIDSTSAVITGYVNANPDGLYFLGIPYAKPPIGSLRFAKPQRNDPSGSMFAFHYGSSCRQVNQPNHDEDCLYLNIITPTNILGQNYPVFFWIHGGAWIGGSGGLSITGSLSNLANNGGIVIVSINYRLGPYGFFSTRDSTVPGNMAMFDMIEALNWVHRYISYFGGDANRITIGGQSAGAWAVSWLTTSPISQPLFNQAITESGAAFCPTLISYNETTRDQSRRLAVALGCTTVDQWNMHDPTQMQSMLDCMRTKSSDEIDRIDYNSSIISQSMAKWALVPDNDFITDTLENMAARRPPINIMAGVCNNESIGSNQQQLAANYSFINSFTRNEMIQSIQEEYHYELAFYSHPDTIKQQLQQLYVDNMPFADDSHPDWYRIYSMLYSDWIFIGGVYRDAMMHRQTNSNVYLYSFDYISPEDAVGLPADLRGVSHSYELCFVFGCHSQNTDDDRNAVGNTGVLWSNFIIYGNPTPAGATFKFNWPKLGTNGEYMSLGPNPIPMRNFHPIGAQFWACTAPTIEGNKPAYCQ